MPGFELSVAAVERTIEAWGMWGVAGAILLMVLHSFVPFPAEIVAMANGMLYGPFWGTVITWTGAMLGAYLAFGLARWLGRPFVRAMIAERHHEKLDDWVARQGGGMLLVSRFVPVISFNLINYAAGLTAISWWTFTWATGLGILPLTFLMVLMGDGLWSGETGAWLWLVLAALGGWAIWWAFTRRRLA
ncbi:MAG TPA: TVP38/TMEM64 family protein [Geminicoccaceae bacterium]|nr:TVP38/TMEM64 family protein [Geminicoccaceae bacterium]